MVRPELRPRGSRENSATRIGKPLDEPGEQADLTGHDQFARPPLTGRENSVGEFVGIDLGERCRPTGHRRLGRKPCGGRLGGIAVHRPVGRWIISPAADRTW